MTSFAIIRTAKIKSFSDLSMSGAHNNRLINVSNAVPELKMKNKRFLGSRDIVSDVKKHLCNHNCKPRSNSVIAVEFLMTASEEYFRPNAISQTGVYDEDRMQAWADQSVKWINEKYGENVIGVNLHLDEATPHLHVTVVPINPLTNKLSAKALITGSPKQLAAIQTEYANALKNLGLQRGLRGSVTVHAKWHDLMQVPCHGAPLIEKNCECSVPSAPQE